MASPTCQVKEGAGAYQATTNGVDVASGASVTIKLADVSGVTTWSISCVATDETQDAATVTAGLTIDSVAKTATFTMPAATGVALMFESKVNNGIGPDGTADATLTTRFIIHVLTATLRVGALGETTESGTDGWMKKVNEKIRQAAGGGSTPTGTGFRHVTAGTEDAATAKVDLTASADVTVPAAGVVKSDGSVLSAGYVSLTSEVANTLPVSYGGTGASTLTSGGVLTGQGTSAIAAASNVAAGASHVDIGTTPNVTDGFLRFGDLLTGNIISGKTKWSGTYADVGFLSIASGFVLTLGNTSTLSTKMHGYGTEITCGAGNHYLYANGRTTTSTSAGTQFGASVDFGGGNGVIGIDDATTDPTTNPTGGGILYSSGGAGKWRGSGGTITTFGPAEPHCPKCGTDVGVSQSENQLFGEELVHCHSCEIQGRGGVVRHYPNFHARFAA